MKFTSVLVVASAVLSATPSFAAPGVKENRSLESVGEAPVLTREIINSIYGRELTDVELQEREPFFPLLFAALRIGAQVGARVGARVGGRVASKVGRKAASHTAKHEYNKHQDKKRKKRSLDARDEFEDFLEERDLEDLLDARDLFGEEVYEERDFDELD